MATSFTGFNELPKELRLQIWEYSFQPRVLILQCRHAEGRYEHVAPLAFMGSPRGRFSQYGEFSNIDNLMRFFPLDILPLASPKACRESYYHAFSYGYKYWTFRTRSGNELYLMWNPKLDIISWGGFHEHMLPIVYAEVFAAQFPTEVHEVKEIAVPSSHWTNTAWVVMRQKNEWAAFTSLKTLIIIVDEKFEQTCITRVLTQGGRAITGTRWTIPRAVEEVLEETNASQVSWPERCPSVRVVIGEKYIMTNQELRLTLRCYPCQDLENAISLPSII